MYFLFDIGATHIRTTVSTNGEDLGDIEIFDTPKMYKEGLNILHTAFNDKNRKRKIKMISGGFPGLFNRKRDVILGAPNLPDWKNHNFKVDLETITNTPVFLENDTVIEGLGEALYGSGKGFPIVVYFTVGTGVGGARIVEGRIDSKAYGSEPGHQIINNIEGLELEDLVSGSGIEKKHNKSSKEITDRAIWYEVTKNLAIGIYNSILHWSPDIVILGGGVIEGDAIKIDEVKEYLVKLSGDSPVFPNVVKAQLGDRAGILGALEYLKTQHWM